MEELRNEFFKVSTKLLVSKMRWRPGLDPPRTPLGKLTMLPQIP